MTTTTLCQYYVLARFGDVAKVSVHDLNSGERSLESFDVSHMTPAQYEEFRWFLNNLNRSDAGGTA